MLSSQGQLDSNRAKTFLHSLYINKINYTAGQGIKNG